VRLGLFGGTFDPPHTGHLLVAIDAAEALALDRLVFIPAAAQPLKVDRAHATPAQRLAMLRALITMDARLEVDALEIERGGVSYSVDTVTVFAERFPAAARFFLIGADVVPTLPKWRAPERIAELARIVVLRRGGEAPPDLTMVPGGGGGAADLTTRRVDISSTEIRDRVRRGLPIRGFVPDAVASYIAAEQLYR
jgi:nicotinate-nucleotide adenylyltransferase